MNEWSGNVRSAQGLKLIPGEPENLTRHSTPPTHRPRASWQLDCTLGAGRKQIMQPLANHVLSSLIARRKIVGSRTLSGQEGLPVVIKTREPCSDVEPTNLHMLQPSALEELSQCRRIAYRKAL